MEKRGKNFTNFEKNLLIDLVLEKTSIIENKCTDGPTLQKKQRAWEEITSAYNDSQQSGDRNIKQLKELYYVLKKKARRNLSSAKVECYKPPYVSKYADITEKLAAVIKDQFDSNINQYDNNTLMYLDNSENFQSDPGTSSENTSITIPAIEMGTPSSFNSLSSSSRKRKKTSFNEIITSITNRKKKKNEMLEARLLQINEMFEKRNSISDLDLEIKQKEKHHKEYIFEIDKKIKENELQCSDINVEIKKLQLKLLELEYKKQIV